jgi:hypothetical protein
MAAAMVPYLSLLRLNLRGRYRLLANPPLALKP